MMTSLTSQGLRCLLLLGCCLGVHADSITWLSFDRPPWFMTNGLGYGDKMQARFVALLPQHKHESVLVNLARMQTEMEQRRNFCISALADLPTFSRHMHMSKTLYVLPQPKIFMREETHVKMGQPASLSIKKLARNTGYHMGLIRGATYLPIRLEDFEKHQHVTVVSSSSPITSVIQMVDLGRIDWAADYPHIVQWGAVSGEIRIEHAFTMVDIEEFEYAEIMRSGIACTKNAWGQAIIERLDELVKKDTVLDIRQWVSQWMPPGAVKEEFYRLNKDYFGY